jgi:hypothetical protein
MGASVPVAAEHSPAVCRALAAEDVCWVVCVCLQKQALLACFFLLGMGLITFTNATKQAADYFNARYKVCMLPARQGWGVVWFRAGSVLCPAADLLINQSISLLMLLQRVLLF